MCEASKPSLDEANLMIRNSNEWETYVLISS